MELVQNATWNERHFELSLPISMFPNVLERLRGTPARLEDLLKDVDAKILIRRDGNSWSIQEVIGHLILVDILMIGRVDDFIQRLNCLRPVDQSDQDRSYPDYNDKEIDSIFKEFRQIREQYIIRLESLTDDDLQHHAVHPRLNQSLKVVDQMYLAAEHDDHHLARISELKRKLGEP